MRRMIVSATGSLEPEKTGVILPHEHVLVDLTCYWREPQDPMFQVLGHGRVTMSNLGELRKSSYAVRENLLLDDVDEQVVEAESYKRSGGDVIVDLTPDGIGRNPLAIKRISEKTGVPIVIGSGYYCGISHPDYLKRRTIDKIADEIVKDLT